jgi:flagellar motor protein MotB
MIRTATAGLAALLVLSSSALAAAPKDNPRCEPNPVFNRYPGEVLDRCERARFAELSLSRRADVENQRGDVSYFKVEGEYWYYNGPLTKDAQGRLPGNLEVRRNFENAVKQAKGEVLFINEGGGRVHFHMKTPKGEFWGESGCGGGGGMSGDCTSIFHKIIRVAAMEQSVVVSADQIGKSITDEGKAVFYGLYFDSGKSVLKPESAPTLVEMAKWLAANPSHNVYIVGHTDMQGSVESNMSLSRARGAAVVEALIKQHGVKPARLASEGVGPYAPLSNNTAEAGRAKNRRVEMVLR